MLNQQFPELLVQLSSEMNLTAREQLWFSMHSRMSLADLKGAESSLVTDKYCAASDKLDNEVEVLSRKLKMIYSLMTMKCKPKVAKRLLPPMIPEEKRIDGKKQESPSSAVAKFHKSVSTTSLPKIAGIPTLIHPFQTQFELLPRSFSNPKSNYGQVIARLRQFDKDAIPCLFTFPAGRVCSEIHNQADECAQLHASWLEFKKQSEDNCSLKSENMSDSSQNSSSNCQSWKFCCGNSQKTNLQN